MSKSKKNKSVREELERIYGKHCMIHQGIRKLNPPKPRKGNYKGKSIASQITLHHLVPRRKGGPTTLENGSLACRSCHDWLEQLSEVEREKVNDELREYKRSVDIHCASLLFTDKGIHGQALQEDEEVEIELPEEIQRGIIELEPMTPEEQQMLIERRKKQYAKFGKVYEKPIKPASIDIKEQNEFHKEIIEEMRY